VKRLARRGHPAILRPDASHHWRPDRSEQSACASVLLDVRVGGMGLSDFTEVAENGHPDCRCLPIQIVALQERPIPRFIASTDLMTALR
jgi:hypothetical protein